MKAQKIKQQFNLAAAITLIALMLAPSLVSADATVTADNTGTSTSSSTSGTTTTTSTATNDSSSSGSTASTKTTVKTAALSVIITKGNTEITRRLNNLSKLTSLISASTKLSASDKANLSAEVTSATSGLTTLKSQLDASTTVAQAATYVAQMVTEYRVYALVDPKIYLIKVADDQITIEANLTTMSQKLQARIAGLNSSSSTNAQTSLTNMNSMITAAQTISNGVDSPALINLQPTDYDSNHAVLSGYNTQLQTAHTDIETAIADAKSIISVLETSSTSSASASSSNTK
jgi:hypothetical protein